MRNSTVRFILAAIFWLGLTFPTLAATNFCAAGTTLGCWLMDYPINTSTYQIDDHSANGYNLTINSTAGGDYSSTLGHFVAPAVPSETVPTNYSGYSNIFYGLPVYNATLNVSGTGATLWMHAKISNKSTSSTTYGLIGKWGSAGNRQFALERVYVSSSTFKFQFSVSADGTAITSITSDGTYNNDTFYAVNAWADGTNLNIRVNGTSNATPVAYTAIANKTSSFAVGQYYSGGTAQWMGRIDDVLISTDVPTTEEMDEIDESGVDGNAGGSDFELAFTNYYGTAIGTAGTTLATLTSDISSLCSANTSWDCRSFGKSVGKNDITGIYIPHTGATNTTYVQCGIHGDEKTGVFACMALLHYIDTDPTTIPDNLMVVPILNPDAYIDNTRLTKRGINENRNSPSDNWAYNANLQHGRWAEDQPETQAMLAAIRFAKPSKIIDVHVPVNVMYYPTGASTDVLAEINTYLAAQNFMQIASSLSDTAGAADGWGIDQGANAYTAELIDSVGDDSALIREQNRLIAIVIGFANATNTYSWNPPRKIPMIIW